MFGNTNKNSQPNYPTVPATLDAAEILLRVMAGDEIFNEMVEQNRYGVTVRIQQMQEHLAEAARRLAGAAPKASDQTVEEALHMLTSSPRRPAQDAHGNRWVANKNGTIFTCAAEATALDWQPAAAGHQPQGLTWLIEDPEFRLDNLPEA